jgi:succinate-acetate transporter protein
MRTTLIILVVIIIVLAYRCSEQNKNLCKEADYEGVVVDGTSVYCYEWQGEQKVLTPLSIVKKKERP